MRKSKRRLTKRERREVQATVHSKSYRELVSQLVKSQELRTQLESDVENKKPKAKRSTEQYRKIIRYFASHENAYARLLSTVERKAHPKRKRRKKPQAPRPIPSPPLPSVEPEALEVKSYTYRTEAFVTFETRYPYTSFAGSDVSEASITAANIEIFHTPFRLNPDHSLEDIRERIAIMRADGIVHFIEISYWQVSGPGPVAEKHWRRLATYSEPEEIPGFVPMRR